MELMLALAVGLLYACGVYLLLRRSLMKVLIGLVLLTNATNLLIFVSAGLTRGAPPLVPTGNEGPQGAVADPLPQAFILTAIVIGFGVLAFAVVLVWRAYHDRATDDADVMTSIDIEPPEGEEAA